MVYGLRFRVQLTTCCVCSEGVLTDIPAEGLGVLFGL